MWGTTAYTVHHGPKGGAALHCIRSRGELEKHPSIGSMGTDSRAGTQKKAWGVLGEREPGPALMAV